MSIAGVKVSSPPGTKAGARSGDVAGQKTDVTIGKQTISTPGGTVAVGTIPTEICTVPTKGLYFEAPKLYGTKGATAEVNVRLDGNDLLASNHEIKVPGATLTVNADINAQAAGKTIHKFVMTVPKIYGNANGTLEVTPIFTGLSD